MWIKETASNLPDLIALLPRAGSANSLNSPSTVTPPRNKLGLMLAKSESNSPLTPESKQGSPFYAEPADAIAQNAAIIPRRRPRNNPATNKYRHSEPGWLQTPAGANSNQLHPIDWEEPEETEDKTPLISSSVDNLAKRLGTKETKKIPRAKPVQPPKIRTKVFNDTSWAVDSSWEFIGQPLSFSISFLFYFFLFLQYVSLSLDCLIRHE